MISTVLDRLDVLGEPDNDITALAQILALAVVAPTKVKMLMAVELAERLAAGMLLADVEAAQALAELLLSDDEDVTL
jgi:hypothetical protein